MGRDDVKEQGAVPAKPAEQLIEGELTEEQLTAVLGGIAFKPKNGAPPGPIVNGRTNPIGQKTRFNTIT